MVQKVNLITKKKKLNKSEKKLSIVSLITKKNVSKDLIIIDDFQKEILKTKEMNNLLIKFEKVIFTETSIKELEKKY